MTPREFLLEFLKFHYKQNQFRKQETNEKDVDDFIAELPADIEVKKLNKSDVSGQLPPLEKVDLRNMDALRKLAENYGTW